MGITFDQSQRLAGYRPSVFKQALLSFIRNSSASKFVDLKGVFQSRRDGAIVFEECLDRGLIEGVGPFAITEKGENIAFGRARPRSSLSDATRIFDLFLNGIEKLNADPHAIRIVEQAWLYGSFMHGKQTVGDIDIALLTNCRLSFAGDVHERERFEAEVLPRYGDIPSNIQPWMLGDWQMKRVLFGPRRHFLLSGVKTDVYELIALGVPCRLVYDYQRGGRIDDPILPHHPSSTGRDKDIPPPPEFPDLTPASLRPMDGRWLSAFEEAGIVSPRLIFRGRTGDARRLFTDFPDGLRVVVNDKFWVPWTPKCLAGIVLDGRERIALLNTSLLSKAATVLTRHIEKSSETWTLNAIIESLEIYHKRKRIDENVFKDIAAAAATLLAVDAERMLCRVRETGADVAVVIRIQSRTENGGHLKFLIEEALRAGCLRIEPEDWSGAKALLSAA